MRTLWLPLLALWAGSAASEPSVEVFLNNNPKVSAVWENTVLGKREDVSNIPSLNLKGSGFKDGRAKARVLSHGKVAAGGEILISSGSFDKVLSLDSPLDHPRELEVQVDDYFSSKIPMRLRRLFGTARFFDGSPVHYPLVTTALNRSSDFSMTTVGDVDGNYEMLLPGKVSSIGIFDKEYSKKNLECWIYEVALKDDTRLDVRLDKVEVYRLYAWPGEMKLYLHFIPMSITRVLEAMRTGLKSEDAIASSPNVWPRLSRKDVRVFLGESEIPVTMFEQIPDITRLAGKEIERPGYIMSVNAPFRGRPIRVEVHTVTTTQAGETVSEAGEGFFLGFLSDNQQ